MPRNDITAYLNEKRQLIDEYLSGYFDSSSPPQVLFEAMKYSLLAGGKRIRPVLMLASYEACGKNPGDIVPQAASLELIHAYSLIHDDLPSMDNDDLRRGKPTNHRVFGEAVAILAGDALLTEAFRMMTESGGASLPPGSLVRAIREIALAVGAYGMVGGQVQDMLSESAEPDSDMVHFIHLHKTAAFIRSAATIGGILADAGKEKEMALGAYGEHVGLAFQIIDDILDIEGKTEEIGKPAGSDQSKRKMTYPSAVGVNTAKREARDHGKKAIESLGKFSSEADPLRHIAEYLLSRRT
jgi:geranylgeranyl diphosphate synthase type II